MPSSGTVISVASRKCSDKRQKHNRKYWRMSSAMALCVLLSNFSSFFATSRFRSLNPELQFFKKSLMKYLKILNLKRVPHAPYSLESYFENRSYQSGFLGARLAKSWRKKKKKLNMADKNASVKKTHVYTGVPTTSSMMGSGLAASNWSLTLSSTADNKYLSLYSQQESKLQSVTQHWHQKGFFKCFFLKVSFNWRFLTWCWFGFRHLSFL